MAKKYDVTSTLIRWLLATEATCGSRVLCLHSDRGVEFRLGVLAEFCSDQGITQSWTLPGSLQQNGVAERCIGLVTEIARTSTIHALAVHFQWPYVVCYAAHQMNLWPRVSRPKASPTSLWTGVFLGFPVAALDFAFYLPPLHQFLNSHDIHFDESVSYYALPPSRSPGSIPSPLPRPHSSGTLAPPPLSSSQSPQQPSALPRQCFKCRLPPHSPPHSARSGGAGNGGARWGSAGAGGAGTRGASFGGAGARVTALGDCGSGVAGTSDASSEGVGAGFTTTSAPCPPPHRHDTRYHAAFQRAREEQESLEQERQEPQQ
ncbi:unnamed protein product [Closterium sp. NIES-54]